MSIYEAHLEKEKLFDSNYDYKIPNWIKVEVTALDQNLPNKEKISVIQRRIKKSGLEAEDSSMLDSFEDFYRNMYEPFVVRRHDAAAIVKEYGVMKKRFSENDCEILFVRKDGQRVAGNIIEYSKDGAELLILGVLNGNADYMKMGATDAVYYFSILRAKERGCKSINLGHCRPFLNDGSFRYKRELGGQAGTPPARIPCSVMRVLKRTPGFLNFMRHNPFLHLENGAFKPSVVLPSLVSSDSCFNSKERKSALAPILVESPASWGSE